MIPIPRWALPMLNDRYCPKCEQKLREDWVVGIGIRENETGFPGLQKGNALLVFDYFCLECSSPLQFIANPSDSNVDAIDIIQDIKDTFEQFVGKKKYKPRNKLSKSCISAKEIKELKRILNESKSFLDFLYSIGIKPEDIKKIEEENND